MRLCIAVDGGVSEVRRRKRAMQVVVVVVVSDIVEEMWFGFLGF